MNEFNNTAPLYLQIIDIIKQQIAAGKYSPGDRIASVRDLAIEFSVNPNTMQRALSELEKDGILFSERTSGRFVTNDLSRLNLMRSEMAKSCLREFLMQMHLLGYEKEQIIENINLEGENT
ncbi:MAG: GntR family transcriptional regulator [Bacillota bacterium]|nr:GntR family transcriptional regulator [Bacillota bacterium]